MNNPAIPSLRTFTQQLLWYGEGDCGTYDVTVLAPDPETAERLIGLQMLSDCNSSRGETLLENGATSFKAFYDFHEVQFAFEDLKGIACPNCTTHHTAPRESVIDIIACAACGYLWQPAGFGPARRKLELEAQWLLDHLDEIERLSLTRFSEEDLSNRLVIVHPWHWHRNEDSEPNQEYSNKDDPMDGWSAYIRIPDPEKRDAHIVPWEADFDTKDEAIQAATRKAFEFRAEVSLEG